MWKVKPLLKDLLVKSNLGAVHPCHAKLMRMHLIQVAPADGIRLVHHEVKCIAPPELILDSGKRKEFEEWESASENLLKTVGETWYPEKCVSQSPQVWEHVVQFRNAPYVQTWGVATNSEGENLAIEQMDRMWTEYWTELQAGRKTRLLNEFPK